MKISLACVKLQVRNLKFLLTLLLITTSSCTNDDLKKVEEVDEHEHETPTTDVIISRQQYDAIKVTLGKIEQKNLTDVLNVTGFLKVPPQNKASITSLIGGTVKDIFVQEGDYVEPGQPLVKLVHPEIVRLQQDYLESTSQLAFAETEYSRQRNLSSENIASQKTFQEAESNYNSLKAKVAALANQLNLLGIDPGQLSSTSMNLSLTIKSPIKGNISHIDINIGSTIEPSKELMNIVDNSQLHLDLFVYEQDLTNVKKDQTVDVTLTNLPGKQYTAKIFAIGSAFEGESKSIPVHAAITGDKTGLIEGMNVTANVNIESKLVPAVPSTAIVNSGGNSYIFVQVEGHEATPHAHTEDESEVVREELGDTFRFKRVEVKAGVTNGAFTEITALQEMEESARVVINGSFYLMSILTNEGEGEHEH